MVSNCDVGFFCVYLFLEMTFWEVNYFLGISFKLHD